MIGLSMLAAATVPMDAATQTDFVCAQATARAIKNGPEANSGTTYERAHAYYLGRLSARDHSVRWTIRWEDGINEAVKVRPLPESQYRAELQRCVGYYIDEMPDLAPE
jgi:hypothetical protein